jgi:molecular chaperone HtpG
MQSRIALRFPRNKTREGVRDVQVPYSSISIEALGRSLRPNGRVVASAIDHRFQVHLGGVIALLSDHLYSVPGVFLRELLQNASDAIAARRHLEPGFEGAIVVQRSTTAEGVRLVVEDNGVGLTEEEIHRFLATIGASSKREALLEQRRDFIGQFGIGLLSCFIYAEEVVVLTRSMAPGAPTLLWKGRRDGTYELSLSPTGLETPGTRVVLRPRGAAVLEAAEFAERVRYFGVHLASALWLDLDGVRERVDSVPPWRKSFSSESARREAYLTYGEAMLEESFVDAIPLHSEAGHVNGMAFVLGRSPHYNARQRHHVYLKGMLLTEAADNLLPPWAFFVRAVVDAGALEPTASREGLRENETLGVVRDELGATLKSYWENLARTRPELLQKLISLHALSLRALALDDDDFFRLVVDSFVFETSLGGMTLGHVRRIASPVRYVTSLTEFRQMAAIAGTQGLCLVNAAYTYDSDLMERLPELLDTPTQRFTSLDLPQTLVDVSLEERRELYPLLQVAADALEPLELVVEAKSFAPADVPVLVCLNEESFVRRAAERTKENSDELFADLLDEVVLSKPPERPLVCFNARNSVVQRLARMQDRALMARVAELLYAQAVLLTQRPMRAVELAMLSRGLLALVEAHLTPTLH